MKAFSQGRIFKLFQQQNAVFNWIFFSQNLVYKSIKRFLLIFKYRLVMKIFSKFCSLGKLINVISLKIISVWLLCTRHSTRQDSLPSWNSQSFGWATSCAITLQNEVFSDRRILRTLEILTQVCHYKEVMVDIPGKLI